MNAKFPDSLFILRRSPFSLVVFLGIGIWALLIDPAFAQVNGPGPSPSSDFDIVLNLPGDEAVITGEFSESIGGVPNQTTQLNVSDGGEVGVRFDAGSGSEVNISGGSVGFLFEACSGSEVNISGGSVGSFFRALSGSEVNISGGGIGFSFEAFAGSDVEMIGGEFRLNGAPYTGDTITLAKGVDFPYQDRQGNVDVFTGTLSDGSAFIFSSLTEDLINVTLTLANLPPVDPNPIVIDSPFVGAPWGLRGGQELTVVAGGSLGDGFAVVDSTLNVEAGSVGEGLQLFNSELNVSDGEVVGFLPAFSNSVVNISGGNVGNSSVTTGSQLNISGGTTGSFMAWSGSEVNISGGTVVDLDRALIFSGYALSDSVVNISGGNLDGFFYAFSGSSVNISGGTLAVLFSAAEVNIEGGSVDAFSASTGSEVNISGGTVAFLNVFSGGVVNISGGIVDGQIRADDDSSVNVRGREFSIDDVLLSNLQPGQPFTVSDRDVTLSGLLADGEPFSFSLTDPSPFGSRAISPDATLTVTLVESFLLGDVNGDGAVNFLDIAPFIEVLSVDGFLEAADINQDGEVNFFDIFPFIERICGCLIDPAVP